MIGNEHKLENLLQTNSVTITADITTAKAPLISATIMPTFVLDILSTGVYWGSTMVSREIA